MFNNLPPLTRNIIIINIIVYIITNFFLYALQKPELYYVLSAYYPFSPFFKSWQIITSMFMHAPIAGGPGLMHIFFNMFILYNFSFLENILGGKRFLILYFLSGIGAYILFNVWEFIQVEMFARQLERLGFNIYDYFSGTNKQLKGSAQEIKNQQTLINNIIKIISSPLLGASGAVFGVVSTFATIFPNARMGILFIPFQIKAKHFLIFSVVISIYFGYSGSDSGTAHFAHVGGAVVGFILAKIWKKHLNRFNPQ
ncbi:Membrane associated serine protease, rhomboid family [Chryseobacterium wanjuense]|uniref:Membrane associated serine protease, rhomboid family n=1 Tax=Chryseobacterium wanjuense TaxID=356305 RepID=A0A1I0RRH0_9FLAO|nr:rhomboid family intramembrane serine protease [Chryseobacterium wanjuense]SEW43788.1 Membrane associated serine protease, rhomboid family [Chryseobacterium wanjuense]